MEFSTCSSQHNDTTEKHRDNGKPVEQRDSASATWLVDFMISSALFKDYLRLLLYIKAINVGQDGTRFKIFPFVALRMHNEQPPFGEQEQRRN